MGRLVSFWNEGAAELLAKLLEEKGLRVEQFAEKLEVSPRTVRNWLRTDIPPVRPHISNLADLCRELGVSQDMFRAAAQTYSSRAVALTAADTVAPPDSGTAPAEPEVPSPTDTAAITDTVRTSSEGASRSKLPQAAGPHIHVRWLILGSVVFITATMAWVIVTLPARSRVIASPAVTFDLAPQVAGLYEGAFLGDVSPDGTQIAFIARALPSQRSMIFVHSVVDRRTRVLPQSEGPYTSFFWNTDSRSLFFITERDLMRISVTGTPPERIGSAGEGFKGTVNAKGMLVLGSLRGLLRVRASAEPEALTAVSPGEMAHSMPIFLPDGDRVLFTITKRDAAGTVARTLAMYSLHSRRMRRLFAIPSKVEYIDGHLLYVRDRTLFARPFDADALQFIGPERPLASPIWSHNLTSEAGFSASAATIALTPPQRLPPLHRVTRDGTIVTTIADPEGIEYVASARGEDELALIARGDTRNGMTVWLYPLDGRESVRLTADADPSSPVFARDDQTLYYATAGTSWANIFALDIANRAAERRQVLRSPDVIAPRDVSPDGRFLLFQRWKTRDGNLWYMPVDDPSNAKPFVATTEEEGESARFSPDGKQVAFVAKRGIEFSIYLADFPPNAKLARRAIEGHAWRARWSHDGKHLYFVRGNGVFEAGLSTRLTRQLFTMDRDIILFEPARDGSFLVRETSILQNRVVATSWWPRLAEAPLDLSSPR